MVLQPSSNLHYNLSKPPFSKTFSSHNIVITCMEHSKNSFPITSLLVVFLILVGVIYFLVLVGVVYIFAWSPSMTNPLPYQESNFQRSDVTPENFPREELDLALDEASMPNKTLIIAFVNKAYVEQTVNTEATMLDVFLESFWLGEDTRPLLDHLLLVALDQTAYDRCKFKRLHCYILVNHDDDFHLDDEKVYMSEGFIKMMWRRTHFLLDVLRRGYSFIFTDTDVLWVRNPFPKLCPNRTEDLQISVPSSIDDLRPEHNSINTGFYYIRSNNKTIALFEKWYSQKDYTAGQKEQDVLTDLMHGGIFRQLDLQVRFLETKYFSGFCREIKDVGSVITIHADCCRFIKAKLGDLMTVLRELKQFRARMTMNPNATANVIKSFRWSPHVRCMNSWKN